MRTTLSKWPSRSHGMVLKLQNDPGSCSITAHVSLKHQAFFPCLLTFQKFCNLHNDAMQKLRGRSLLRKCSPRKANPSPLSDSSSLLIVVCMEDKEKKVGLVWMISLRGVVWRVSVFFVVLSCVVFCFCHFFFLCCLRAYDR